MKRFTFLLLFAWCGFWLTTCLTGCSSDNEEVPGQAKTAIRGDYTGKGATICIEHPLDSITFGTQAQVTETGIRFDHFPIAAIVDSVFGKKTALEQQMTTTPHYIAFAMHKTPYPATYAINYRASSVDVLVKKENKAHHLRIDFSGSNNRTGFFWYYQNQRLLTIDLYTENISVDGKNVRHFASYPDSIRKPFFEYHMTLSK